MARACKIVPSSDRGFMPQKGDWFETKKTLKEHALYIETIVPTICHCSCCGVAPIVREITTTTQDVGTVCVGISLRCPTTDSGFGFGLFLDNTLISQEA